jgi:hypothetical protein
MKPIVHVRFLTDIQSQDSNHEQMDRQEPFKKAHDWLKILKYESSKT